MQNLNMLESDYLLQEAIKYGASDIHLTVGHPVIFRINGKLNSFQEQILTEEKIKEVMYKIISEQQRLVFEEKHELDFSSFIEHQYSFRVNMHMNKGTIAVTIRILANQLKTFETLGLPPALAQISRYSKGLILLVGKAGSGKTTTMTHMVDLINQEKAVKIVTIEDPIEYIYCSKKSLIVQREVGVDTQSFATGLKYALRQDPDVVVVGEMRDLESIAMALTTAETGHLVIGTLHASDAVEAINRIIDVYPGDRQDQIRVQLAENLVAVVGQQLLPHKTEPKRVLSVEMLIVNMAIRNMIRRNSHGEIRSQMETGREGMCTIEQSLKALVKKNLISEETAIAHAKFPQLLGL